MQTSPASLPYVFPFPTCFLVFQKHFHSITISKSLYYSGPRAHHSVHRRCVLKVLKVLDLPICLTCFYVLNPHSTFLFTVIYIHYDSSGSRVSLIEALHTRCSGLSGLHWGFVRSLTQGAWLWDFLVCCLPHMVPQCSTTVYVHSSVCMSECVSVLTCFVRFCHSKTWASRVSNETMSSATNGQSRRWNLSNTSSCPEAI